MPMPSSIAKTLVKVILLGFLFLFLLCLFIPAATSGPDHSPKSKVKMDIIQLATACLAFETEYGYLPGQGRQAVGGDLLAALVGSNSAINPRNIVFIDIPPYRAKIGGVTNGAFHSLWNSPYQIALATGTNNFVLAGTNHVEVRKRVAVWTLPDEAPSSWWQRGPLQKSRRYVTSWD